MVTTARTTEHAELDEAQREIERLRKLNDDVCEELNDRIKECQKQIAELGDKIEQLPIEHPDARLWSLQQMFVDGRLKEARHLLKMITETIGGQRKLWRE